MHLCEIILIQLAHALVRSSFSRWSLTHTSIDAHRHCVHVRHDMDHAWAVVQDSHHIVTRDVSSRERELMTTQPWPWRLLHSSGAGALPVWGSVLWQIREWALWSALDSSVRMSTSGKFGSSSHNSLRVFLRGSQVFGVRIDGSKAGGLKRVISNIGRFASAEP